MDIALTNRLNQLTETQGPTDIPKQIASSDHKSLRNRQSNNHTKTLLRTGKDAVNIPFVFTRPPYLPHISNILKIFLPIHLADAKKPSPIFPSPSIVEPKTSQIHQ